MSTQPTANLQSYRCPTRKIQQAFGTAPEEGDFLQLKARNATEAMQCARMIAPPGCIVVDVERLD